MKRKTWVYIVSSLVLLVGFGYYYVNYTGPYANPPWAEAKDLNTYMQKLQDKDARNRISSLYHLREIYQREPYALDPEDLELIHKELMELSKYDDDGIRCRAIREIGYFGFDDPEVITILAEAITDPSARVREAVMKAVIALDLPPDVASPILEIGRSLAEKSTFVYDN